jgi:hypothetical protein
VCTNHRPRREEAVQGAGMVGPFHVQGAAESDASVRLRVRSHVPGTRRDRAPADEAGIRKAKPQIETPSVGIRRWAVFKRGSAHEPPPENIARERDVARPQARRAAVRPGCASGLGSRSEGEHARSIYTPEPPLCTCSRAGHRSVREPLFGFCWGQILSRQFYSRIHRTPSIRPEFTPRRGCKRLNQNVPISSGDVDIGGRIWLLYRS